MFRARSCVPQVLLLLHPAARTCRSQIQGGDPCKHILAIGSWDTSQNRCCYIHVLEAKVPTENWIIHLLVLTSFLTPLFLPYSSRVFRGGTKVATTKCKKSRLRKALIASWKQMLLHTCGGLHYCRSHRLNSERAYLSNTKPQSGRNTSNSERQKHKQLKRSENHKNRIH